MGPAFMSKGTSDHGKGPVPAARYIQVRYRIGLVDNAMVGALAERVADRRLVVVRPVRRNLRYADQASAQVLNELVGGVAVALASVTDDFGHPKLAAVV